MVRPGRSCACRATATGAIPTLIALVERLAIEAQAEDGWNGLLVGDLAQPRGGPMLSGHASHQVGLDADVWLTAMPDRTLSRKERETINATVVVKDRKSIDKKVWTESHARLIKRAASYPEVARIFVHPPIKAELCKWATGDRSWLAKVRPYFGHNYHFHIRINCPKGSTTCKNQPDAASEGRHRLRRGTCLLDGRRALGPEEEARSQRQAGEAREAAAALDGFGPSC